jgi:hypothetical protein
MYVRGTDAAVGDGSDPRWNDDGGQWKITPSSSESMGDEPFSLINERLSLPSSVSEVANLACSLDLQHQAHVLRLEEGNSNQSP